jgi:Zn-dependent protease
MVSFTSHEIRDIIISLLVLSGLFTYIFTRGAPDTLSVFINYFPIMIVAVGLGFLLHELAHKFVALRYGYPAEYKMWLNGLILSIVIAVAAGVVFALPGAVYVYGVQSKEENGKISIAGPLTSISLAVIFLLLMPVAVFSPIFIALFFIGFFINSFLAFLNMLPVGPLDGRKVLEWNPVIWAVTTGVTFILFAYAWYLWFNF